MKLYDENEAIGFIRSRANVEQLSNDDLLDIIDVIFDYYDENGDLDLDFDDETDDSDDDEAAIISYVTEELKDSDIASSQIAEVVRAELAYEQSLL